MVDDYLDQPCRSWTCTTDGKKKHTNRECITEYAASAGMDVEWALVNLRPPVVKEVLPNTKWSLTTGENK